MEIESYKSWLLLNISNLSNIINSTSNNNINNVEILILSDLEYLHNYHTRLLLTPSNKNYSKSAIIIIIDKRVKNSKSLRKNIKKYLSQAMMF